MSLTARMIDAIEHPLTDQTISITTRAQPWVDELIRKAKAEAWDGGWLKAHATDDPAIAGAFINPYRFKGDQ